jgi:hypothetical protein
MPACAKPVCVSPACRAAPYMPTGPTLDVPHTVTPQQLEVLLNGLLQNEEKMPYSFYIEGQVCAAAAAAAASMAAMYWQLCTAVTKAAVGAFPPSAAAEHQRPYKHLTSEPWAWQVLTCPGGSRQL